MPTSGAVTRKDQDMAKKSSKPAPKPMPKGGKKKGC